MAIGSRPLPTIKVPDIGRPAAAQDAKAGSRSEFDYVEYEVTEQQAAHWRSLNDKEQLTLVLKADQDGKEVRDYL